MKKRRILSLFIAFVMVLSIIPTMSVISSAGPVLETDDNLLLVWSPDLEGATIEGAGSSNRNYVKGSDGRGFGLNVSSSGTNVLTVEGDALKFTNTPNANTRLQVAVAGTGSTNTPLSAAGFLPDEGKSYLLAFDAENAARDAAASVGIRKGSTDVALTAISGTTRFTCEFSYPEDRMNVGDTHGTIATNIVNRGAVGQVIYVSNIIIYEILCPDCMLGICECECEDCGKFPCECPCEDCGAFPCECACKGCGEHPDDCVCCPDCKQDPCGCIAKWQFTKANYPASDAPPTHTWVSSVSSGAAQPSDLKYISSGGVRAGLDSLIRNHHASYPNGSGSSGAYDNTQNRKHMVFWDSSSDPGWIKTMGWSNLENYIYLDLDTSGYENLVLFYDIRTSSTSTPSSLKLQYSLDFEEWIDIIIPNETVQIQPVNTVFKREEHLPVETYDQEQVYIRWSGTSGSTSGHVEFKNIVLSESKFASPYVPPEPDPFSHINLAPGADSDSIGFSWFSLKGVRDTAIIQVVEAIELVNDEMPETKREIEGINGAGSLVYDTNKVTVDQLVPGTTYAYRVGDGEEWSDIYTFKAQDPESYQILVVADPQTGGGPNHASATSWRNTLNKAFARVPEAAFILSAGDQTEYGNALDEISGFLSATQLRSYPFAGVYGNHDHLPSPSWSEKIMYLPLMYNWPNAQEVKDSAFEGHNYYFSYGNTLYVNIDSNVKNVALHDDFMKEATESHPDATWIVATFHHDIYGGSRHAGSFYADSSAMQPTWSPFLDKWNVDIVYNGHDHLYTRSKFIDNDTIQRFQMSTIFDQDVRKRNPGTFIQPNGILYMALASPGNKFYELEQQEWIAYADTMTSRQEYTVMNIEGDNVFIETYRIGSDNSEHLVDSITLSKKATREDLEEMLPGAKLIELGSISEGWDAFQSAIEAAEAVLGNDDATPEEIHDAFTAVYDAYFALETSTDKRALNVLIRDVKATLAAAVEGQWVGQYPPADPNADPPYPGSKAVLKGFLDAAIIVYDDFLATVEDEADVRTKLAEAYQTFLDSVSDKEPPWKTIHPIGETGGDVDLIGWMDETITSPVWGDTIERYDSNLTKLNFATGSLPRSGWIPGNDGVLRTNPRHGPDNGEGGRGLSEGHIRKTYIGEWIRYEVDVEKAGMYNVQLGAKNTTSSVQQILLRDTAQNVLATFNVTANNATSSTAWANVPLVAADKQVYLPAGKSVIEIYFRNTGATVSNRETYVAGADVDILRFTRTGDGTPAVFETPADRYYLPVHPFAPNAMDVAHTQRGWASTSHRDAQGNYGTVPVEMFKNATHFNVQLATNNVFSGGVMQFVVVSDTTGWTDIELYSVDLAPYFDDNTRTLSIPLTAAALGAAWYKDWQGIEDRAGIFMAYYASSWNEMNIMRAWLTVPQASNPCKDGHTKKSDDCAICVTCAMVLQRTCSLPNLCVAHNSAHPCYLGHAPSTLNCNNCDNGCGIPLGRACPLLTPCGQHSDGETILEERTRDVKITYNPSAAEEWAVWGQGNDFLFQGQHTIQDADYRFEFDIDFINDTMLDEAIDLSELSVFVFGLGNESTKYTWKALAGENYTLRQSGNKFTLTLSTATLGFDFTNLADFGVQIAVNDDAQYKFAPHDNITVTISYKLILLTQQTSDCAHTLVCSQCNGCRDTTCRSNTAKSIVGAACTCGTADCKACDCYILGDLNNDGNINISDALQILMKLARIPSSLVNTDTRARRASLVVAPIANPTTTNNPTISDVLQVLMKIAKITSATPDGTIDGRSRNNAVTK